MTSCCPNENKIVMVSMSNHAPVFYKQVVLRQAQDDSTFTVWAMA
ncbi:MAG: hypothetical protein IEMM0002_0388 [bacterium]|nr:MAG: hypothetical protein IEMM0002_0388 [bacterium]